MAVAAIPVPSVVEQRAQVATWGSRPMLPGEVRPSDPKQAEYFNQLISSQQRIGQIGQQPVSIINLNPYPLIVLHPLFDGLKVEPIKTGSEYSALVIKDVKYQVNQGLDHNHTPVEFWPIQLANEFVRQYEDKGGVFLIKGNLLEHPELANTGEFKQKFHAAREQLYTFAFSKKQAADNVWNTPGHAGAAQQIQRTERMMAQLLFDARKIPKLPEWMDALTATDDVVPQCPACKSEPVKGALICKVCAYTLDPAGAFKANIIPETHIALERLTRAQVKELGISAFVAETVDEQAKRLAAGDAKPFSVFEQKQFDAREKANAPAKAEKSAKPTEGTA